MCYIPTYLLHISSVTLTVIFELVTILGSGEFGRYFSLLFVIFQPMFCGSQVRSISNFIMSVRISIIKGLIFTYQENSARLGR